MTKKPSPQAVSAWLGKKFTRSTSSPTRVRNFPLTAAGFVVRSGLGLPGQVEHVAVEHTLGDRGRHMPEDRRRIVVQEQLTAYRQHLEQRYRVTVNDQDGPDAWDALLVWTKEGEARLPKSDICNAFLRRETEGTLLCRWSASHVDDRSDYLRKHYDPSAGLTWDENGVYDANGNPLNT